MASELSDYLANKILDWVKGTNMPAAPTTVYVALNDGDPTNAGTGGTDVTSTIRTAGRVAIAWGAIASRAIENNAAVDFGVAAGGANVTHLKIYDAASAGNMLGQSALDNTRAVTAGDPVVIPIGDLNFNFN